MQFDVLTLFPEMFSGYLGQSLLKRAIERGLVAVRLHNLRDWSPDKHHTVDDRPYGGGPGMILKVEPVVECVESVRATGSPAGHLVMLTPQGRRLDQEIVEELAAKEAFSMQCQNAVFRGSAGRGSSVSLPQPASLLPRFSDVLLEAPPRSHGCNNERSRVTSLERDSSLRIPWAHPRFP